MITFSLGLKSEGTVVVDIRKAAAEQLNEFFRRTDTRQKLTAATQEIIIDNIKREPEYEELISPTGVLRGEFGLDFLEVNWALRYFFSVWQRSVRVDIPAIIASGRQLRGTIILRAINADFMDILTSKFASYMSRSKKTGKETQIPWIEWLLLSGSRIIIRDHYYAEHPRYYTRSGLGWMEPGGMWRVPQGFAGTLRQNWITRAMDNSRSDIVYLFLKTLFGKL